MVYGRRKEGIHSRWTGQGRTGKEELKTKGENIRQSHWDSSLSEKDQWEKILEDIQSCIPKGLKTMD